MKGRSRLSRALTRVTWAGCLAMVFVTFTNSPVLTQLFIELGATDVHIGFLGGLPMVMLGIQGGCFLICMRSVCAV